MVPMRLCQEAAQIDAIHYLPGIKTKLKYLVLCRTFDLVEQSIIKLLYQILNNPIKDDAIITLLLYFNP